MPRFDRGGGGFVADQYGRASHNLLRLALDALTGLQHRGALVATAHKIARTVYYMLQHRVQYHDMGAGAYEQKQQERELAYLKKKAAKLGFTLVEHALAPVATPA